MSNRLLPAWASWVVAAIGVGILAWIVAASDIRSEELNLTWASVAILLVAQVTYLVTESLRLQAVLERAAGMTFERVHMFGVFVMARILNLVVPQSGNVYRVVAIRDRYGAAMSETVGGLAGFVWLSVSASLALSTFLFALGFGDSTTTSMPAWLILAGLTLLAIGAPWVILALLSRITQSSGLMSKLRTAAQAALAVARSRSTLLKFAKFWAATIAVIVVMYGVAFSMIGTAPSIPTLVAIYALVQATSFVVITPGNIGIQEIGFTAVAVFFGSDPGVAAAAALIIRISGITVTAATGVVIAATSRRTESSRPDTSTVEEDN